MSTGRDPGRDYLARRSDLAKTRAEVVGRFRDFLVIEDEAHDAGRLEATLHLMFGYDIQVRRARTLGSALDCVIERKPDIAFLDDILKPSDSASQTIPFLRRCGYDGPIIVVSGQVTRQRRAELAAAGAVDVVHKDDVDTVRIAEALEKALASLSDATSTDPAGA
jgi:DNA-binding NarL/FixJ family response regulator